MCTQTVGVITPCTCRRGKMIGERERMSVMYVLYKERKIRDTVKEKEHAFDIQHFTHAI